MKRQNQERRFPLHVHISVLFSLLLLGSGVLIGLFNYYQTTQVILSSSSQLLIATPPSRATMKTKPTSMPWRKEIRFIC